MRLSARLCSFSLALLTVPTFAAEPGARPDSAAPAPASSPAPVAPATAVAPAPTSAAPAAPAIGVEPFGYFFSRLERRDNYGYEGGDGADFVRYRAQLGIQTTRIPLSGNLTLQARIAPQVGGFWNVGGDTTEDPVLGLHEGFLRLEGPMGRFQVGRFEMSYGEELVIGAVGWNHIGRAFDGARLRLQKRGQGPWIDLFATQVGEGTVEAVVSGDLAAGDRYFLGAYAGLGPWISKDVDFDLYALNRLAPGYQVTETDSAAETGSEWTLGTRFKGKRGILDARLEAGVQVGSRQVLPDAVPVLAWQADAEVGVTLPVAKGLRLGVEGLYASGDDPATDRLEAWDQLYPTAHKWLGFMDVMGGRSNVAGGVVHLKFNPVQSLALVVDGHTFFRPQHAEDVDAYVGTEIDTGLIWSLGKAFSVRGAYDIFLTAEGVSDEPLHFVELELLSRF